MTIPSNNIQDDAYEVVGHGARASFPNITGGFTQQIQQALAKHLEEKNIDIHKLSLQEKHNVLNTFLQTSYNFDKDLLPKELKREAIAQEKYFLDEILHDASLSQYTTKTQGSIPMAQAIVVATINNLLALSGLPVSMVEELKALLAQDRSQPIFSSINAFRSQLQSIIDKYDPENPSATEKITPEQQEQIMSVAMTNSDIIQTLKSEWAIDEDTYNTLTSQTYENRPEEYKKVFATQLRKQFTYSYLDTVSIMKESNEGIGALISMPRDPDDSEQNAIRPTMLDERYRGSVISKYADKVWLDAEKYKQFLDALFDPNQKEVTIPGPDWDWMTLKFLKKEVNPFDFVIDASDQQEIQKLASTMPYKNRHTVNGQKFDPQQNLSVQINNKKVDWYAYKIMHNGEEQYVFTQELCRPRKHTDTIMVLTKDGTFKTLKDTTEEETVIIHSEKKPEQDPLQIGAKNTQVFSMQPVDVSWLLTAYCLNNSSNLSDADKKELFVEKPKKQKLSDLFKDQILGHDEANKKALEHTEQYTWEINESYEQRMEEEREGAFKSWNTMPWVKETKFEKWAIIAIQNVDSIFTEIPGNGGYTLLELTDCDNRAAPTKFKYKIVWGTETDIAWSDGSSLTGQESNRLAFSEERFSKLKDFGRGTVYKFPPTSQQGNLLEYAKTLKFDNQGMDEFVGRMDMLSWKNGTLENNKKEEIKYFGIDIVKYTDEGDSESFIMFETKFSGDRVSVKDKVWSYHRDMTLTEFVIFMADKGLRPYSQREYDEDISPIALDNAKNKKAFFVMSPMNIINGVKQWYKGTVVAWIEKSQKRREEKIEEIFYTSGVTNLLWNIPIYGEYFVQAQDEFDTKLADKHHKIVMEGDSTINQWWKKLVRGKQTYIDNHNLKGRHRQAALDKIAWFFEKAAAKKPLDDVERREAMAWLLYVLEKFQTPYPRTLAKYAGQQLWPKLLLNNEKYISYMRWFNKAKHKLEQGQARWEDVRDLMNNVMQYDVKNMSELMKDEYHRYLYGFKTIPVLQEHWEKRTNDTARKDGMTAAWHHPAFARAYQEEVRDKLSKWQYGYAIGGLIQISKRKEMGNPANYRRWMTGVLQVILSWGMRYAANIEDRKYLRDFLRKHGLPISDYILDNAQGGKDLAVLLEVISRNAWCSKTFLEGTGWNPSLESYENWSKNNAHAKFNNKMDVRFLTDNNAQKIIPFLENNNLNQPVNLITIKDNPKIDPKLTTDERWVLDRYLDVSLMANNTRDFDAYKSKEDFVQNSIQDRTIFNTSRWLVNQTYMNYNMKGTFNDDQESVQYFWNSFRDMFKKISASDHVPKQSVGLLLKKYYTMFQDSYAGHHERFSLMLGSMKVAGDRGKKIRYAEGWVSQYIARNSSWPFPPMMKEAFGEFEKFLVKYAHMIDTKMIENIMYDESNLEATWWERKKSVDAFENIQKPWFRKKYGSQMDEYLTTLSSKNRPSQHFKWFNNKSTSNTEVSDDVYNSRQDAQDQENAYAQAEQEAANQREQAEKDEEDQKHSDQKAEEEEKKAREKKEEEEKEAEAKRKQEEEDAKNNGQWGGG